MKTIFFALIFICTFFLPLTGKLIILGSNSPEEQIIYPGEILEGPDTNIYIYDSQDAFIKVFSPEGKLIRKIGGKGEGPGQFKRADGADFGFTPDGKQIYFTEFIRGHNWITYLNMEGELVKTVKYNIKGSYGILHAVPHRNGSIYLHKETYGKEILKSGIYYSIYSSEILTIDSSGSVKTTILKREHSDRISFIRGGGDMGIPFSRKFIWVANGKGEIIFTDGTSSQLEVYDIKGSLKKTITVPVPEQEIVTKEDLAKWRKEKKAIFVGNKKAWYKRFGSVIEKYTRSIFKFKPVILGMSLTPSGNIFLKCRTKEKDKFKYVLTKIDGELISESISELQRVKITKNYVFFIRISEEEEQEISFMKRSGGETKGLCKVFDLSH